MQQNTISISFPGWAPTSAESVELTLALRLRPAPGFESIVPLG